ncbi:hypothetical protein [Streptomyces sp. Ac-502]|uniref:hypothetical protein n=1 Tax=Streptomyces sp. Ac-502 TaxID=3342801 RepID=UPI0038626999
MPEIRIEVSDEVYEELQRQAAGQHVPAETVAQELLTADVVRSTFNRAAAEFIHEHAAAFAERFGGPAGAAA